MGAQSNRRLITLGTPHLGSPAAAIRYVIGLFVAMDSGLTGYMNYNYNTQGLRDLDTKSEYIKKMKTLSSPPIPYRYYTIAAINDPGAILYGLLNVHASFLIDGPDDGVVAVASALGVPGAESPPYAPFYIPVALAHMQMTEDATIYMCIINYLKDPVAKPTISTSVLLPSITTTSAQCGGVITSDGNAAITSSGICWSTFTNPTISDNRTSDGTLTGSFLSTISGLTPHTIYYVRSYATNSAGTGYGNEVSFTTSVLIQSPILSTTAASSVSTTSATSGGNVTSDGNATVTARGVCWSPTSNPTVANNKTTDGTGTGSFTSSLTGLTANTTYYVRAYATNSMGTSYGSQVSIMTTSNSGGTVTDIDGNVYNTVTIGTQVWMVENLKTTKYNDGTSIPNVTDNTAWGNLATPGYCWYNNDVATNKNVYGALYNWFTVNTGKLCPTGWHVPSDTEWTTLTTYLGGVGIAGGKLKETGTSHWYSTYTSVTNETGFTALPGGERYIGLFDYIGSNGIWWSSTETMTTYAWIRNMCYNYSDVNRSFSIKQDGKSVRCLRD